MVDDSQENDWARKSEQGAWSNKVISEENDWKKADSDHGGWAKKAEESTWGTKVNSNENDWTKIGERSTSAEETRNTSAWGKKVDSDGDDLMKKPEQSAWGRKADSNKNDWAKMGEQAQNCSAWGKKADSDGGDWAEKDDQKKWARSSSTEPHNKSNWAVASGGKDWGEKGVQSTLANAGDSDGGGWAKKPEESTWVQKVNSRENDWTKKADSAGGDWAKKDERNKWASSSSIEPRSQSNWTDNNSTWGKDTTKIDTVSSARSQDDSPWSSAFGVQKETPQDDSSKTAGWSLGSRDVSGSKENQWETKPADQGTNSKPSGTWGSSNDWAKFDSQSPTGEKKESPFNAWGSSQQSNDSAVGKGWGSSKFDTDGEKDVRSQWGRGRGRGRGWGRGRGGRFGDGSQGRGPSNNDGEWRNKRPRPSDDPNVLGLFTVTRQRLDLFTAEEQDVLSEMETVMKNIRRVMHQTGYNDGDPISADDQAYIIDNVLNYHPDKAVKMGAGIDHFMVSRHGEFQDSRCFYAVSVDGGKTDFSYRKCLENFIREKYADKADTFIPKYFKKPQPRSGWNRDRGPPHGEAGTPTSWNRDSSIPASDEAGTPGWAGTPGRTGTQSWAGTPGGAGNSGWAGTPERAETPGWAGASGWNKDQSTPGPDAAATAAPVWDKDPGPVTDEAQIQTPDEQ